MNSDFLLKEQTRPGFGYFKNFDFLLKEKNTIHFYLVFRTVVFVLWKSALGAPGFYFRSCLDKGVNPGSDILRILIFYVKMKTRCIFI